jgi:hypothetical protein
MVTPSAVRVPHVLAFPKQAFHSQTAYRISLGAKAKITLRHFRTNHGIGVCVNKKEKVLSN